MRKSSIAAAALCWRLLGGCIEFSGFAQGRRRSQRADRRDARSAVRWSAGEHLRELRRGRRDAHLPVDAAVRRHQRPVRRYAGQLHDRRVDVRHPVPEHLQRRWFDRHSRRRSERRRRRRQAVLGIAEVLEAMDIGFAADVWGDIPYAEAVGANPTPKFEGQMQVYTDLLTLLDKAIADIGAGGTGPGWRTT